MSNQEENNHEKLSSLLAWEIIRLFSQEKLKKDYFREFPLDKAAPPSMYSNHANNSGEKDELTTD